MWRILAGDRKLRENFLFLHLFWFLLVICSFYLNHHYSYREVKNSAITRVQAIFEWDLAFRRWAASHGGVYVPTSELTPPNPYLEQIPERDIITPSGKLLTLMNPAYISRQINENFAPFRSGKVHITSLKPLRLGNEPDPWEKQALLAFEGGLHEVMEFTSVDNEPMLRYMRPLVTAEPCLKCHGRQDYIVGDIRGGISVSLPMGALVAPHEHAMLALMGWHLLVYLGGVGLLLWGQRLVGQRISQRNAVADALEASERKFRYLADFAYAWEYWLDPEGHFQYISPSVERLTGYPPRRFMADPDFLGSIIYENDASLLLYNHLLRDEGPDGQHEIDFRIRTAGGEIRWLRHICQAIYSPDGVFMGRRASNYDITDEIQAEEQLGELIVELKGALDKVKLLSGFLPICASCKNIRDDRGYWKKIENYISENSEAVFSHGICPDCARKLYPEFSEEESD